MIESSWKHVHDAILSAPYPVTVLDVDEARGQDCLAELGITERSWLGAVVRRTGGLLLDSGWLRVFGSGSTEPPLPDILSGTSSAEGVSIAVDVLGGTYRWRPNETTGEPTVHYFAPDTVEWEDLGLGYGAWLGAVLDGRLTEFYADQRWPGWEVEVAAVRTDQGIHTWPPAVTEHGRDLSQVSRRAIPMSELVSWHEEIGDGF